MQPILPTLNTSEHYSVSIINLSTIHGLAGEKLENILLVNQYKGDLDKAKELGIQSQTADHFLF